ncbi:MAG: effector-associated domain EAD1-containing protein, partial [Rhizonema sp. PD37]|nr:effector-associated domain EAD1-containing protein [Rhizonema sp. PD37]
MISGQQRKQLQDALIDAFPTKTLLEQMLSFELNRNLDEIAGGSNLQEIIFNLIKIAEAHKWVEDLVCAASSSNPGNLKLQAIILPIQFEIERNRDFFNPQTQDKICKDSEIISLSNTDGYKKVNEIEEQNNYY